MKAQIKPVRHVHLSFVLLSVIILVIVAANLPALVKSNMFVLFYLLVLFFPGIANMATVSEHGQPGDDIDYLEKQMEQLLQIQATIQAKHDKGEISDDIYRQKMHLVAEKKKLLEEKLNDSIAAIMFNEEKVPFDPLAVHIQQQEESAQEASPTATGTQDIVITDVKRGLLNDERGLEIKFTFQDTPCKALINSKEGKWHIKSHGKAFYLFQFLSALENSNRFFEVFEKEAKRHAGDWLEVVCEGKTYMDHDQQKNTLDNFPDKCRQIIRRHSTLESVIGDFKHSSQKGKSIPDLTGKQVTIHKVERGQYTHSDKKDFGRGFPEFPRQIIIYLSWGQYRLKAEITTDQGEWIVTPADTSQHYTKELLEQFKEVIPFMIQELEKPTNTYLAHALLTEMRKKEYRHQWEQVIKGSNTMNFPLECRELFEQ